MSLHTAPPKPERRAAARKGIAPRPVGSPARLSFAQERLWFLDRLQPGSVAYIIRLARRLIGSLDLAALERALAEVVRRHEALRTTFSEGDEGPVQVIAPFEGFVLPLEDLAARMAPEREAEIQRRVAEERTRPFNLATGPLFRARLLRLDRDEHILLLSVHHIVADGWSLGVLFQEIATLYGAYCDGSESPLPALAVQYADYAAWQRAQWQGARPERQLAYWKAHLAGAPARLALPADRPRPVTQSYRGASEPLECPLALREQLEALARSQGATLYMVLLAAFTVLLSKYSSSDDIVVGSPIAGRTRKELEPLVGFFVNTLVLRTSLGGDPTFRELLRRVREVTLGAYEHSELPFEKLVAELQPERSLSHAPLFQVLFELRNPDAAWVGLPGLTVRNVLAENETARFDLALRLAATPEGLAGELTYSTDLFERTTVQRMVSHLGRVLEQVAAGPDGRVSAIALVDAAERALVLDTWNQTATAYPTGRCLHELFELQAARTPEAVAAVCEERSLRYGDLDRRANQLAQYLRRLGVGPEVRVGLCFERSLDLLVAILGVLKAGGAYVPLDPDYPAERLAYLLADAGAPIVLTHERVRDVIPSTAARVVGLDAAADAIAAERSDPPTTGVAPQHLAYVIYTSGSTGRPKGTMNAHGAVVNRIAWMRATYPLAADDVVLQKTPTAFDVSVWEMFWPLVQGASLVVARPDGQRDAAYLQDVIERRRVTTVQFVPSMLPPFLEVADAARTASLRRVICGGEALAAPLAARVHARWPGVAVLNLYGPTETAGAVTHWVCDAAAETIPIGRPVWNTHAYVLDEAQQPVPAGVRGELYIGGVQVGRGYLDRPGLTAARFVPDPFGGLPGGRLYRTGDRARWRADGTIEFLGRLDRQVKIRGVRIEVGEIEAALRQHPDVRACVVVARGDASEETQLVAYVVGEVDSDALRAHLRRYLPEYMVPAAFVPLARLPLSPNGKLDVAALPAPEYGEATDAYVPPRTPVEELLAGIWAELLGLPRVGANGNFFALGGHSLLAMRVVSRIRDACAIELPVRVLFEQPTVAGLAEAVERLRRAGSPPAPPIATEARTEAAPLSFAQERLWFLDRLQPGSAFYNVPTALRLEGTLEIAVLERALGEIVRRHDTLRTTFCEVNGVPVQVVAPCNGFVLPVDDLSTLDAGEREGTVERYVKRDAAEPFDLVLGPLFRARLLRVAEAEHVLLVCMHHLISDGWSRGVFFRELSVLYGAFTAGTPSPLPELPVQYADYVVWQRAQLGETLGRDLAYWRARLAGAPALLALATDHPRPAVQTQHGAQERMDVPLELTTRLQVLARREGATLFMVVLGAFQALLAKHGGSDDVVVGSPIAGRSRRELEPLIGLFVNTLVLRTDLSGDPTFREVLRRVREVTLGAYEHKDLPLEKLVEELQPERSLSHAPLVQVLFTVREEERTAPALPGLRLRGIGAEGETTKSDLVVSVAAHAGGLRAFLTYNTDLFERSTAQRMLRQLARVLEQVAADPELTLSDLELLDAAERTLVIETWNQTDVTFAIEQAIPQLVEAQVRRTPDAMAVVSEGRALTYAELNARANRVAHYLRRLGVGPEVRVGICVPRGVEMVVAMLAVLKASGTYVPLDVSYPAERLAFMVADSGMTVLLTDDPVRAWLPVPAGVAVVSLDRPCAEIDSAPPTNLANLAGPRNAAYVIYTSGSSGRPKGVVCEHHGVSNLSAWHATSFEITGADRITQLVSGGFDVTAWELWPCLTRGACLHVVSDAVRADPHALHDWLVAHAITLTFMPPAIAEPLLAFAWPATTALRWLQIGGDRLRARPRSGLPFPVRNNYGPTETTIGVTSSPGPVSPVGERAPSIGAPIANTRAYVLDSRMRPLPSNLPGELYLGGVQVGRGYLNRPALTAERFLPDPFAREPGARLYRTGDRVRWSTEGTLEFLERLDAQVKVRGFRIELGEIEAVLREQPQVRDCLVLAREDVPGETRLVAYVVGEAEVETLRAHLRRKLPDYMLPAAFVTLDRLPLSPNGKLDRAALPAPVYGAADERSGTPQTLTEEVLAGIWAEVLHVERVRATDGFFELGGHSLLAIRLVARMRQALGIDLPLRTLFETATVRELARTVDEMRRAGLPAMPPVTPVNRDRILPLSFAQERLWFLDRLQPESALYNVPLALGLEGPLDVPALTLALAAIVRRHEALRTVFVDVDGAPGQVVRSADRLTLPVENLSRLDVPAREAAVRQRLADEASRPFDLATGPLVRARLLRLHEQEHVLLLTLHHIVSDGWSMEVLFRELSVLYDAYRDERESPLPDLPVQYADYAVWQRAQMQGEALDRQLTYWKARLTGAPALLPLPTDRSRPAVQSYRGAHARIDVSSALLHGLRALGRCEGATLYMVLLAAFQALLAKYSGSTDVVVGSPIAGRARKEAEGLIGFFVNTLVLRTDLSGDPSFRDLLRRVRDVTLGAFDHQDVPFEKLVSELQVERSLSHSPLFQVLFTLHQTEDAQPMLSGLRVQRQAAGIDTTKFDLMLNLAARASGLRAVLTYNADLFEPDTAARMLGHFARVLEQIAASADKRLSRLELLDAAERAQVVETWNRTAEACHADGCVHELFEAQAAATPAAVAVVCGQDALSYRDLNARANQLAHHLRRLGVGPDVRVGICLERRVELVVAMLGVLKAGGGYVPLDPRYPAERLRFMLADVGAAVVLTHAAARDAVPRCDGLAIVDLDRAQAALACERTENIVSSATRGSLAYVIYTSGSTGTPKGTQIEHRHVVRLLRATEAWFRFDARDVWTLFHSSAFDFSVWEIWGALLNGGRLVVVPFDVTRDPEAFHALVSREGVTVLNQTPSAFRQFIQADALSADALALRQVIFGGEALEPASLRAWVERHGAERPRLVNMYGITETTVHVTYRPLLREDVFAGTGSPIGERIPDLQVHVLDAVQQPVPIGIAGELYVGGEGVARGYLNRPSLTATRFVPDPFGRAPGGRLYRTGDFGRWLADGTLEYRGRADAQVKIRGFRIEPAEIEATLAGHSGVRACAVVAREDVPGEKRLVAYVVGSAEAEDLRAHLRQTLPDYMVPAAFVSLDALPLTSNGKLDVRALPAPSPETRAAALPPRTQLEERVARVWENVLGIAGVGVHENFFDLGGNSLLLYRVYSQFRAMRADLQVVDLFRYTTVEQVAAYLSTQAPRDRADLAKSRSRGEERRAALAAR